MHGTSQSGRVAASGKIFSFFSQYMQARTYTGIHIGYLHVKFALENCTRQKAHRQATATTLQIYRYSVVFCLCAFDTYTHMQNHTQREKQIYVYTKHTKEIKDGTSS